MLLIDSTLGTVGKTLPAADAGGMERYDMRLAGISRDSVGRAVALACVTANAPGRVYLQKGGFRFPFGNMKLVEYPFHFHACHVCSSYLFVIFAYFQDEYKLK
jgi:hypothetical protein